MRTTSTTCTEDDQTKAELMLLAKKVEQQGTQINLLKDQVLEVIKTATAAQVTTEMQLNGLLEDITHFCTDLQAICSSAEQQSIEATNTADKAYKMATEFKLKVLNNPAFNQAPDGKTVLQMMARTITLLPGYDQVVDQVATTARQAIQLYGQQGEVPKEILRLGEGELVEKEKRTHKKQLTTPSQSKPAPRLTPRAPTLKIPGKARELLTWLSKSDLPVATIRAPASFAS